jgi:transposase
MAQWIAPFYVGSRTAMDCRAMGADSGAFSRREHPGGSSRTQTGARARAVLEAVLWILDSGAQWHMLPQCDPNHKTVHRRFRQWCGREVPRNV